MYRMHCSRTAVKLSTLYFECIKYTPSLIDTISTSLQDNVNYNFFKDIYI